MSVITIDPPASLPVDYLSLSSLRLFMMCPTKWRRRYLEHEPEPPSGKMLLGSSAGAALSQHYGHQIESGQGLSAEALLDEFATDWEDRIGSEDVDWGTDVPGQLKDSGAGALAVYHRTIAPRIVPVSVEREFQLSWPGVDWVLSGFIDLEDADGIVRDFKMRAKRLSQRDADADLQPDVYLAARRAEGNPAAGFAFDTMVRTKTPVAEVLASGRTDERLDRLSDRVFGLAAEIAYRCDSGNWGGASPNTWFCSTCRYDCPLRLGII
jgi:putative RecB family exonuclease